MQHEAIDDGPRHFGHDDDFSTAIPMMEIGIRTDFGFNTQQFLEVDSNPLLIGYEFVVSSIRLLWGPQ
ncbi:hypothetical protein TNCV_2567891 [Trichonephila clavipes]|uniref:Uncharacterized protein n=1 Tax=Trichonephila clavipes TaxID=2585209 RepID=A0A8X7BNJ0_TRICX|nr:hypothetical protein TNCV_2567891 [Trichonephila clavipes]